MPPTGEEIRQGQSWPSVQRMSETEKDLEADPWVGVSVSRENPKGAQGYLILTYLHPQAHSSSPIPPHKGPYLSWKPPQGAESLGSKGVRGHSSGGGPGHAFLVPKASVQGLFGLSYAVTESPDLDT